VTSPEIGVATIALLSLAGFGAGLVDSIAGGGGLITVPVLFSAGIPVPLALATNKGQASFGAISSFLSFWTRGEVDKRRALLGFAGGFLGSLAGALLLLRVPSKPLKPISLVLLMMAAGTLVYPRKTGDGKEKPWAMAALLPISAALGFYDGFFGPGVGSMLIVTWVLVFGDALTRASGNAKVVNLASNLAALLVFVVKGAVIWKIAAPMAVANSCGSFAGARLAVKKGDRFVKTVVLGVVTLMVLKMAYELVAT
jgi:uncharacterized membrane protein YfcA